MLAELEILGEYANEGFSLEECDDHVVALWFKDTMVAAFSQIAVSREALRDTCKRHLQAMAGVTQ